MILRITWNTALLETVNPTESYFGYLLLYLWALSWFKHFGPLCIDYKQMCLIYIYRERERKKKRIMQVSMVLVPNVSGPLLENIENARNWCMLPFCQVFVGGEAGGSRWCHCHGSWGVPSRFVDKNWNPEAAGVHEAYLLVDEVIIP